MKLLTTKIDDINYSVAGKISNEIIENKINQIAQKASKSIKIDGFRAGKVPLNVVLARYKDNFTKEAEQEAITESFQNAVKEIAKDEKSLIGEPLFKKFDRQNDGIEVEYLISFKPEIKLDGYEALIPELKIDEISADEIAKRKENVLMQFAKLEKSDKESLEKGDFAKFDFEGFVDGVAFEGGKAENYVLEIGSNQFIPGFEDGMIGLKVGEERDVNVKFPAEYQADHLAGKDAVFKVKLHEISTRVLPELNEDLLKKMLSDVENPTEKDLEDKIKEQLENEAKFKKIDEELKQKFVEAMIEKYDFLIPLNILEQETNLQFNQAARTFTKEDFDKLKDEKYLEEKKEEYKKDAAKSVKLTFIVDELAKLRNISVNDQELAQAIYFEALRYGIDPKKHLDSYNKNGTLPAIRMSLLEEKLFADIFLGKDK